MGFKGIEKFIDSYRIKRNNTEIFVSVPLKNLKFVIDGVHLSYMLLSWLKNSHYGGNYDQFYDFAKKFFQKLKPYIEIIIFIKANSTDEHYLEKMKKVIKKLQVANLEDLKTNNCLFSKNILYEIFDELEISYLTEMQMVDIAAYANGLGPKKEKFTVLSKDTYFNAFNLEKGYLSWYYANDLFRDIQKLNESSMISIFYLDKWLNYFNLNYMSWIWFNILCGDNIKINKNEAYFPFRCHLDRDIIRLIDHLRMNERNLIQTDFREIKRTYMPSEIQSINELIRELRLESYNYIVPDQIDDQVRNLNRIKTKKINFYPYLIEDYQKNSVFDSKFISSIYMKIYALLFDENTKVIEYIRNSTSANETVQKRSISLNSKLPKLNNLYNYIKNINDNIDSVDNLSLFLISLGIWLNILDEDIDQNDKNNYTPNSSLYLDVILTNFISINLKDNLNAKDNEIEIELDNIKNIDELFKNKLETNEVITEIISSYSRLVNINFDNQVPGRIYYSDHIKIVHYLNQFQAVYYTVLMLNLVSNFRNMKILNLHRIMNGYFLTKSISESSIQGSDFQKLNNLVNNSSRIKAFKNGIKRRIEKIRLNLTLEEGLNNLDEGIRAINLKS